MTKLPLLWRWSIRDLRERWLQVLGIAVVIALGVAVFGGLGSTTPWRQEALDKSYEMLNTFDLRLELVQGSTLQADALKQALQSVPHADWIQELEVRLIFPTTLNASSGEQPLLVSSRVVGVQVSGGGPDINQLHVTQGRGLAPGDAGELRCVLEYNFATYHGLTLGDRKLYVGGGHALEAVGVGMAPEYFWVMDDRSGGLNIMAQDRLAVLFVPLQTAQAMMDRPGQVNSAVITVAPGRQEADLDVLKAEVRQAMAQAFPQVGFNLDKRSEDEVHALLYEDVPGDQQMFDTFSFILLAGAAFGAFILIGRIVDAQRREIGINMALGVSPWRIARRYLLISFQIAFLGVVLGIGLGLLLNRPIGEVIKEIVPLPYFEMPFQPGIFIRGALIGLVVPFLAIAYPVWQAVRVPPVDAIQTGYLVSKGGGLAPLLARFRLPGSSFFKLPLRNLSRGMRRTVLTALGLSMAIVLLIATVGMMDTFYLTLDAGRKEINKGNPDRLTVLLDDFYAQAEAPVSQVASTVTADPETARLATEIVLPGTARGGQDDAGETIEVLIQMMDMDNPVWSPSVVEGTARTMGKMPGILLTHKAARDLGVAVGDEIMLTHPYRESGQTWRLKTTPVQVTGIHAGMLRTMVYMDARDAALMNLEGVFNSLELDPPADVGVASLRKQLSQIEGVASVHRASAISESVEDMMDEFLGIFQVIQGVVLLIVFLLAFNTTRSNIDERRRELATMFAFGTRIWTVVKMSIEENLIIGLLGTALGIGLGWGVLNAMVTWRVETLIPELSLSIGLAPTTLVWAVAFGVLAVALTPVLMTRQLVRMDIPSTLRVVE